MLSSTELKRRHLPALDPIERGLQADQHVVDALNLGELVRLRLDDDRRARFQPRFAIRRRHEDHGVADRGGFGRADRRRRIGGRAAARWPDRTGGAGIGDRAERGGARFERGLPAHDLVELLVELFLIEQLAAGGTVDLRAQFGDAVLIGVLHLGLTGDQPRQDVVAKREIGGGRRRPHAQQDDRADNDPEHDGAEANLLAGMHDGVAVAIDRCRLRRVDGTAGRRPAMIVRVVVVVGIMMTGTVRHRHSRAGRRSVPYGSICVPI